MRTRPIQKLGNALILLLLAAIVSTQAEHIQPHHDSGHTFSTRTLNSNHHRILEGYKPSEDEDYKEYCLDKGYDYYKYDISATARVAEREKIVDGYATLTEEIIQFVNEGKITKDNAKIPYFAMKLSVIITCLIFMIIIAILAIGLLVCWIISFVHERKIRKQNESQALPEEHEAERIARENERIIFERNGEDAEEERMLDEGEISEEEFLKRREIIDELRRKEDEERTKAQSDDFYVKRDEIDTNLANRNLKAVKGFNIALIVTLICTLAVIIAWFVYLFLNFKQSRRLICSLAGMKYNINKGDFSVNPPFAGVEGIQFISAKLNDSLIQLGNNPYRTDATDLKNAFGTTPADLKTSLDSFIASAGTIENYLYTGSDSRRKILSPRMSEVLKEAKSGPFSEEVNLYTKLGIGLSKLGSSMEKSYTGTNANYPSNMLATFANRFYGQMGKSIRDLFKIVARECRCNELTGKQWYSNIYHRTHLTRLRRLCDRIVSIPEHEKCSIRQDRVELHLFTFGSRVSSERRACTADRTCGQGNIQQ